MFHLLTHAFFKALLFLGAGSVMHAMGGVIDIRQLRRPAAPPAGHALDVPVRLPGHGRRVPVRRLLEQGRDPGGGARAGRHDGAADIYELLLGRALLRRLADRLLHVPAVLPDVSTAPSGFRPRPAITPTSRPAR